MWPLATEQRYLFRSLNQTQQGIKAAYDYGPAVSTTQSTIHAWSRGLTYCLPAIQTSRLLASFSWANSDENSCHVCRKSKFRSLSGMWRTHIDCCPRYTKALTIPYLTFTRSQAQLYHHEFGPRNFQTGGASTTSSKFCVFLIWMWKLTLCALSLELLSRCTTV